MTPGDLPTVLQGTAAVACQILAATSTGAPAECRVYHSIPPDDGCCDFLAVWLESIFTYRAPFPAIQISGVTCDNPLAATIAIKLRRPCWPLPTDDPFSPFPPTAKTAVAALSLAEDAAALYCGLRADLLNPVGSHILPGSLWSQVAMSPLTPERNMGGCAGWVTRWTVAMSGCCPAGS